MLRMVTYGDNSGGRGMNSLLNSNVPPGSRCVSKQIAILNGTSTVKMLEFEASNPEQTFPDSRLIPVWPIEQSQIPTMCTQPFDSRNNRLGSGIAYGSGKEEVDGHCYTQDSFIAGYTYTFEIPSDASWLHVYRDEQMINNISVFENTRYAMDDGAFYYADPLPAGVTRRSAYITVHAQKNDSIFNTIAEENQCDTVCPISRAYVYQELASTGDDVAAYTGINTLTLSFGGSPDATNTYIKIAAAPTSTALSGTYYANGTEYGVATPASYAGLVSAPSGSSVQINIQKLREQGGDGHFTVDVYGTWEGVGDSSNLIPVPKRDRSSSIDVIPNGDDNLRKQISGLQSYGNMNITGLGDIDSMSNMVDKMKARCGKLVTVVYDYATDTVSIRRADNSEKVGIGAEFYPNTLDGATGKFVWMGSGASVNRTFEAISTTNKELTIGMVSRNNNADTQYQVFMHPSTAADSYVINGTTVTSPNDKVVITGNSFTIDLRDSSKYVDRSTHRFYVQQIVPVSTAIVASGNASPEYADIQFTINQQ